MGFCILLITDGLSLRLFSLELSISLASRSKAVTWGHILLDFVFPIIVNQSKPILVIVSIKPLTRQSYRQNYFLREIE